jgi:hypothetical protein
MQKSPEINNSPGTGSTSSLHIDVSYLNIGGTFYCLCSILDGFSMLAGRQQEIHAERDRKLEVARKQRQIRRHQAA